MSNLYKYLKVRELPKEENQEYPNLEVWGKPIDNSELELISNDYDLIHFRFPECKSHRIDMMVDSRNGFTGYLSHSYYFKVDQHDVEFVEKK